CASRGFPARDSALTVIQARSGAAWIRPSPDVTTTGGSGVVLCCALAASGVRTRSSRTVGVFSSVTVAFLPSASSGLAIYHCNPNLDGRTKVLRYWMALDGRTKVLRYWMAV